MAVAAAKDEDYQALERRDREIIRHLVISLAAGIIFGMIGTVIHVNGLTALDTVFDPYVYFVLIIIVGHTAQGLPWAALSSILAALGPVSPALIGLDLTEHAATHLGDAVSEFDLLLVLLFVYGMGAYLTRRPDRWGDVAAGLMFGVLAADLVHRVTYERHEPSAWFSLWNVVVGITLLVLLAGVRPTLLCRARSLIIAMVAGAGYLFLGS
ncbi:MAG TPA: hypothetical protein VIR33_00635 [Thermopolyspora sp.]